MASWLARRVSLTVSRWPASFFKQRVGRLSISLNPFTMKPHRIKRSVLKHCNLANDNSYHKIWGHSIKKKICRDLGTASGSLHGCARKKREKKLCIRETTQLILRSLEAKMLFRKFSSSLWWLVRSVRYTMVHVFGKQYHTQYHTHHIRKVLF